MEKFYKSFILCLFLFSLVFIGCTPDVMDVPTLEIRDTEVLVGNSPDVDNDQGDEPEFTLEAGPELKEPIKLLYSKFFDGEEPVFVEENGDLIVTKPIEDATFHPDPQSNFLPDGVLIPQSNSTAVDNFIKFALSADGQQVLIEGNYLPDKVTLTDQAGNQVEINLPVRRLLSAYGPVTSIVYSVDAQDRFVSASYLGARDPLGSSVMEKMDPRFPEIQGDESFSQSNFNIEEAASLDPDLILANARSAWLDSVSQLDIPVFLYDPESPEKLKEAVLLTGQIFGPHSTEKAELWVQYFEAVIERIGAGVEGIPEENRFDVLFTGTEPLRVVSGDMFQSFIIDVAGGNSVSSDLEGYWNNVNLEQIAIWDPDVIIVPPYGGASIEAIIESQEWQILEAVQEGRVYRMPKLVAPWDTPAPDAILGIIWMGERLYDDEIGIECEVEAQYFYQTFFDYQSTEEELASICSLD